MMLVTLGALPLVWLLRKGKPPDGGGPPPMGD
jgi:hypothetical protein